jgi:hypothetical protein
MIVFFSTCDDILLDPKWKSCFNCIEKSSCFKNVKLGINDLTLKHMWCREYQEDRNEMK